MEQMVLYSNKIIIVRCEFEGERCARMAVSPVLSQELGCGAVKIGLPGKTHTQPFPPLCI